jgi:hypothetical protein
MAIRGRRQRTCRGYVVRDKCAAILCLLSGLSQQHVLRQGEGIVLHGDGIVLTTAFRNLCHVAHRCLSTKCTACEVY